MQRTTRVLLRAARALEYEAREYVAAGKDDERGRAYFGQKAKVLFGTAVALRAIAKTGYAPTVKTEQSAGAFIADYIKSKFKPSL